MAEERLQCSWCNAQNPTSATSCGTCGAPLNVADVVTESGWRSAPRVRDATTFGFSQSTCELEGEIVPAITDQPRRRRQPLLRAPRAALEGREHPASGCSAPAEG